MNQRLLPTLRLRQVVITLLAAGLQVPVARAQFTPTGAGPFDYNTTGNWTGGTINGVFSQTPSVAQAVTFGGNSTLTTGLTFGLGGSSKSLTLRGDGTERTVTLGGDVSVSGTTSAIVLGSTTAGNGLNVVLGADRTISVASGNTLTVNNVVSGANALTKTGVGQLTLAGANTYTGTTTVNTGTLFLNASGALASGNNVVINSTTAASTASLALGAGFTQTIGTLNFSGSGGAASSNNIVLNAGSTLTLGGTVTYDGTNNPLATTIGGPGTLALGGNRTFDIGNSTANPDFRITAPISGTGFVLTKTGAGRMDLSGANSYDGGTIVNGGTLFLNTASPLQATSPVTVSAAGGGTATYALGVINQTVGALTLGGADSTSTSFNNVVVNPSGTLTLSDTVTYLATNNPRGSTIGPSGAGAGTVALGVLSGSARTFAVADSTNPLTTNELTISIPITGAGGLTKTGAGTLRLSGDNTYTGGTTVSAGGLFVTNTTGSGVGTGALTIESGASLYGTGTIGGATTVLSGGALGSGGSGNAAGNLTFTNGLTLNNGAVFNFQLGTTSDKFTLTGGTLTGAVTSGQLTIHLTAGAGFGAGVYTLFDYSTGGVVLSSFDVTDFALGTTIGGYTYSLASAGNMLQLTATASAIPEPSTYAAIFGALSLVGAAVWRRRQAPRG